MPSAVTCIEAFGERVLYFDRGCTTDLGCDISDCSSFAIEISSAVFRLVFDLELQRRLDRLVHPPTEFQEVLKQIWALYHVCIEAPDLFLSLPPSISLFLFPHSVPLARSEQSAIVWYRRPGRQNAFSAAILLRLELIGPAGYRGNVSGILFRRLKPRGCEGKETGYRVCLCRRRSVL